MKLRITTAHESGGLVRFEYENADYQFDQAAKMVVITHDGKPGERMLSRVPLQNVVNVAEILELKQ